MKKFAVALTILVLLALGGSMVGVVTGKGSPSVSGVDFYYMIRWLWSMSHRTDFCTPTGMIQPLVDEERDGVHWYGPASWSMPSVVSPGQQVTLIVNYDYVKVENYPIVFVDFYGDWEPDTPLHEDKFGLAPPGGNYNVQFTFTAPSVPGKYRIRWMDHFAFMPMHSFFGGSDGGGTPGCGDYTSAPHHWTEFYLTVQ